MDAVNGNATVNVHDFERSHDGIFNILFSTFKNGVVPYDGNLTNYPKETKELIKLCNRVCDRIAKEIK